jgi:hypothetical protein
MRHLLLHWLHLQAEAEHFGGRLADFEGSGLHADKT